MQRRSPLLNDAGAAPTAGSVHAGSAAAPARPTDLGGFRLVRRLDDDGEVATWVARGGDETVILRVFRESASDARIDAETLARERLSGPCAPELLDIATSTAGRPVLVVRAVIGPTLDDLLERAQAPLRAGHLTTLLAPLAALVSAAHETGATLGRLDGRAIRIDPSGRPVVVGLGRSAVSAPLPERFRAQEPRIVADRVLLDDLARALATRVDRHERASVEAALANAAGHPERLELALFDCAAPLPLLDLVSTARSVRDPETARSDDRAGRVTERFAQPFPAPPALPSSSEPESSGVIDDLGRRLGLPSGLLAPLDGVLRYAGDRRERVRAAVRHLGAATRPRPGRPRRAVMIVGALGALCLVVAVALSLAPHLDSAPSSAPSGAPTAGAAGDPGSPAESDGSGVVPQGESSAESPESLSDPSATQWPVLVDALVDRWLACAVAPDRACAARVAQADSAASDQLLGPAVARADVQQVLASWAAGARVSVVVDRHGGAAVVDLIDGETATASLLVMRSEAGWRVRAVLPSVSS